jgi:hypothetical protein
MKYAQYLPNGQIVKTGVAPQEAVDAMLEMGQMVIILPDDFAGTDETHYMEEGAVVAMPPNPSPHHVFDYTMKQWIDPRTPETEWPIVRDKRNRLLLASDWTQLPDVPIATKEAWAAYRQALRDVTLQPDPFAITWPVAPN